MNTSPVDTLKALRRTYAGEPVERAALDAAIAALTTPRAVGDGWRPIESAPKDETLLLLGWNRGKRENGAHVVIGSNYHGRWLDRGMDEANRDLGNHLAYIEYWQPLPAAPGDERRGDVLLPHIKTAGEDWTPMDKRWVQGWNACAKHAREMNPSVAHEPDHDGAQGASTGQVPESVPVTLTAGDDPETNEPCSEIIGVFPMEWAGRSARLVFAPPASSQGDR